MSRGQRMLRPAQSHWRWRFCGGGGGCCRWAAADVSASCGCYRAGDLPSSFPIKLVQPPPPPTHPPAEALAKHFDPQHIDDSLGGHIPIEQLFDYEGYGERMKAMDAQVCVWVGGWVVVVGGGGGAGAGAAACAWGGGLPGGWVG